jgi:hypothetical protein
MRAHMARTRPGTSPKVFAAFCKNVVAFNEDASIVGDCATVEVAEVEGVTATMGIEDAEAVRSSWVSSVPSPKYARLTVRHNWREEMDSRLVFMGTYGFERGLG